MIHIEESQVEPQSRDGISEDMEVGDLDLDRMEAACSDQEPAKIPPAASFSYKESDHPSQECKYPRSSDRISQSHRWEREKLKKRQKRKTKQYLDNQRNRRTTGGLRVVSNHRCSPLSPQLIPSQCRLQPRTSEVVTVR